MPSHKRHPEAGIEREETACLPDLDEVAEWHINCPEAGKSAVKLPETANGFNWPAPRVEKFWEDVISGDTLSLVWGLPWNAITPMTFVYLAELAGIQTPEWEEFLLFSTENNPMWQLDCPMPTASTFCWKEKICQLLKHRQGEEYERLNKLVKTLPRVFKLRIPAIMQN